MDECYFTVKEARAVIDWDGNPNYKLAAMEVIRLNKAVEELENSTVSIKFHNSEVQRFKKLLEPYECKLCYGTGALDCGSEYNEADVCWQCGGTGYFKITEPEEDENG